MKLRFLIPVVVLLSTAGSAQAGIRDAFKDVFRKPGSLPKPISLTDDRVDRSAVATQVLIQRHPPGKYSTPDWGSRFDQIKNNYPPRPLSPSVKRSE